MKCVSCNGRSMVLETRLLNEKTVVYRRRKCRDCGRKFSTLEFTDVFLARNAPELLDPETVDRTYDGRNKGKNVFIKALEEAER